MTPKDVEDSIFQGRARQGGLFAQEVLCLLSLLLLIQILTLKELKTIFEEVLCNHGGKAGCIRG
jgi:hypothetical protein